MNSDVLSELERLIEDFNSEDLKKSDNDNDEYIEEIGSFYEGNIKGDEDGFVDDYEGRKNIAEDIVEISRRYYFLYENFSI